MWCPDFVWSWFELQKGIPSRLQDMVISASIQLNYIHPEADSMDILQFQLFLDSFSWKRAYFSNKFGFNQLQRVFFSALLSRRASGAWHPTNSTPASHPTWTVQRKERWANLTDSKCIPKPYFLDIESKKSFQDVCKYSFKVHLRCTEWCFPNHKISTPTQLLWAHFCPSPKRCQASTTQLLFPRPQLSVLPRVNAFITHCGCLVPLEP